MTGLLSRTTRGATLAQIRHVEPVRPGAAGAAVAAVYAQVERDFGMLAPPVALHSPSPRALAACWALLRETLLAAGQVDRPAKEVVATAVSLGNTCGYCVDVHDTTLYGLVAGPDARAFGDDRAAAVTDPRLREVFRWARAAGTRDPARRPPPFSPVQAPEYVGVAVAFHYLNRMVNVFLDPSPMPGGLPDAVRRGLQRLLGRLLRGSTAGRDPGDALALLPGAEELPADLSWAAANPCVAAALAAAAAAFEAAGVRAAPPSVRAAVHTRLSEWDGAAPGLSRSWVEDEIVQLPAADRPAGRLALLTALASYQVDAAVIEEYRFADPDDAALVDLTSWAAFAAARRAGTFALPARA
jgi:alkylhydroperoxidase family enzyme